MSLISRITEKRTIHVDESPEFYDGQTYQYLADPYCLQNPDHGSSDEPDIKENKPLEGSEDKLNHANHASQDGVYAKYEP